MTTQPNLETNSRRESPPWHHPVWALQMLTAKRGFHRTAGGAVDAVLQPLHLGGPGPPQNDHPAELRNKQPQRVATLAPSCMGITDAHCKARVPSNCRWRR